MSDENPAELADPAAEGEERRPLPAEPAASRDRESDDGAAEAAVPLVAPAAPVSSPARRLAFLALPAIALLELGAHLVQTHSVVSEAEWRSAGDAVRSMVKPEDLVVVAPRWADPVAREVLKDELLSVSREARPDATRFPRAVEMSIRGQHEDELKGWKLASSRKVGPVTLGVYDNPSFVPVKDDLVDHAAQGRMTVSVVSSNGSAECELARGRVETGPLGFGPAIPQWRFACPQGGLVAATVMQPGDYRPHRCLFTPPIGPGRTYRIRFVGVTFGALLHGHAGIDWDSIAHPEEGPVTLVWKLGDRTLGRISAGNDDGWKGFALNTRDLEGQTGDLVAEVSSTSTRNRLYCFEADTR